MNIHFEQHTVAEELADTMFFCTGLIPAKMKTEDGPMLSIGKRIVVSCRSFKHIHVNGHRCKSIYAAKHVIMDLTA